MALSTSSNRKRHERAKHPLSDAARIDGRFVHPHFDSRIPNSGEDIEDLPPPSQSWNRCAEQIPQVPAEEVSRNAEQEHKSVGLCAPETKKRKMSMTCHAEFNCADAVSIKNVSTNSVTNLELNTAPESKRSKQSEILRPSIARATTTRIEGPPVACDEMMLDSEPQQSQQMLASGPVTISSGCTTTRRCEHLTDERKYDSELTTESDDDDYAASDSESHSTRSSLSDSSSETHDTDSEGESASDCSTESSILSESSSDPTPSDASSNVESDDEPEIQVAAATALHGKGSVRANRATASADWTKLASLPGVPQPLEPAAFHATCEPFITWLSQPPITQSEAMVKARRVRNPSQVTPIRNNLRFLLVTMHEQHLTGSDLLMHCQLEGSISSDSPQLEAFTQLDVCQQLFDLLIKRRVGSARVHALFLLIKKVLVYLSSVASLKQRQYIAPVTFPSFFYVDSVCADASLQRKQEGRNRSLLGMQASPYQPRQELDSTSTRLTLTQSVTPTIVPPLRLPTVREESDGRSIASHAEVVNPWTAAGARTEPARAVAVQATESLTKGDLQMVASGCLKRLEEFRSCISSNSGSVGEVKALSREYVKYLATATLCLGLAPRSQVLRELQLGTTLAKHSDDGRYWVKMLAELNKNGKPCMMAFPAELTQPFDFYFEHVRPQLLAGTKFSTRTHAYVFFKRDGQAPRPEFSTWTTAVTMQLIGRPINAHAFRAGVITTFYENGASQGEMDVLASLMAHDSATAKTHYFRPQFAQAAVRTNDQMTRLLLPAAASVHSVNAQSDHMYIRSELPAAAAGSSREAQVTSVTQPQQSQTGSTADECKMDTGE